MELNEEQRDEVRRMYYFIDRIVREDFEDYVESGKSEEEMIRFMRTMVDVIEDFLSDFSFKHGIRYDD